MKHQKNQDQEIIGLIQIVNSPQVIIDCLVYVNDDGELKKKKIIKRSNSLRRKFPTPKWEKTKSEVAKQKQGHI